MGDVLFTTIEKWQGQKPWGRVLDAGTGAHSLKWLLALPTDGVVAITADDGMKRVIESDPEIRLKSTDRVVVGNWMNQEFCEVLAADASKFDTIIADYLIGAVDGFSPYCQELVLGKLKDFLVPGGNLYIVGMEPIPDHALSPADVITEVRRARDACIQLAGHRPYREYPQSWMTRTVQGLGLTTTKSKNFTILHSQDSINRQIRVAKTKLSLMSPILRDSMEQYLTDLSSRVASAIRTTSSGKVPLSFDYVLCVEHASSDAIFHASMQRVIDADDSSPDGNNDIFSFVKP